MNADPPAIAANPWTAHSAEVVEVVPEITGVATYHLRLTNPAVRSTYSCCPGQFNMLYLPGVGEAAISVSGYNPTTESWLHTVRTAGGVTQTLAGLGCGGKLALRGPFGSSWPIDALAGRDVVFVAGGIGLAPLRPAIDWALNHAAKFGRLTLLYGARSPATILYADQLDTWRQSGLHVEVTVDRTDAGWMGRVGVVTLLVDRLRSFDPHATGMLTCGPDVMMKYVVRSALERGLKSTNVWVSLERNMQCAVGFCGHCQLGPAFVCKDGPVFRYDRMASYLDTEAL